MIVSIWMPDGMKLEGPMIRLDRIPTDSSRGRAALPNHNTFNSPNGTLYLMAQWVS